MLQGLYVFVATLFTIKRYISYNEHAATLITCDFILTNQITSLTSFLF